mmetsp:Transcript_31583/g.94029  ORF Transcript_31583/g.94029 Transcript_31583/m.94029 type:complete len:400 (+) Transcript_31583:224-1423(+)
MRYEAAAPREFLEAELRPAPWVGHCPDLLQHRPLQARGGEELRHLRRGLGRLALGDGAEPTQVRRLLLGGPTRCGGCGLRGSPQVLMICGQLLLRHAPIWQGELCGDLVPVHLLHLSPAPGLHAVAPDLYLVAGLVHGRAAERGGPIPSRLARPEVVVVAVALGRPGLPPLVLWHPLCGRGYGCLYFRGGPGCGDAADGLHPLGDALGGRGDVAARGLRLRLGAHEPHDLLVLQAKRRLGVDGQAPQALLQRRRGLEHGGPTGAGHEDVHDLRDSAHLLWLLLRVADEEVVDLVHVTYLVLEKLLLARAHDATNPQAVQRVLSATAHLGVVIDRDHRIDALLESYQRLAHLHRQDGILFVLRVVEGLLGHLGLLADGVDDLLLLHGRPHQFGLLVRADD